MKSGSPKGKYCDLLSNSLNWFFKEMSGDQSWESVCGYSRLRCYGNYIWICANRPTSNSTFRQVTERTYPETTTWSSTSRYFSKIYKRTNPRIGKIQILFTSLCWQQRIIYTLWRTTYFYRQRLRIKERNRAAVWKIVTLLKYLVNEQ